MSKRDKLGGALKDFVLAEIGCFHQKHIFYYISGPHKQYIQVDTIPNYRFHFGLPGKCLYLSPQNTPFWRRRRRQKGVFPGFV